MEKILKQETIPEYCMTSLYCITVGLQWEKKKKWEVCQEAKKSRNLNFATNACSEKEAKIVQQHPVVSALGARPYIS